VNTPRPCLLCRARPPADGGYVTCQPCGSALLATLEDLARLYRTVVCDVESLLPSGGRRGGGSHAYGSSSPTSDALLDITDARPDVDGLRRDVHGVLAAWADHVREASGLPARPTGRRCRTAAAMAAGTVTGEVDLLRSRWRWIRAQPAVVQLARAIHGLHTQVLTVAGERPGAVSIGRCTATVTDEHTGTDGTCGRVLTTRVRDHVIRCRCGAVWPRSTWPALGRDLRRSALRRSA
jgi:hypothetical protein